MGGEFESFQRQALIERLTRRFAEINEYQIESHLPISEVQHPQIQTWLAMAEAAVDEIEKENLTFTSSNVQNFLARHDIENYTEQGWEELAKAEGLTEEEINELME